MSSPHGTGDFFSRSGFIRLVCKGIDKRKAARRIRQKLRANRRWRSKKGAQKP